MDNCFPKVMKIFQIFPKKFCKFPPRSLKKALCWLKTLLIFSICLSLRTIGCSTMVRWEASPNGLLKAQIYLPFKEEQSWNFRRTTIFCLADTVSTTFKFTHNRSKLIKKGKGEKRQRKITPTGNIERNNA